MKYFKIKNIRKTYDKKEILKDININIKKGDFVSILGPSGCGKSTLLKIITGIEKPDEGCIYMEEKEITKTPVYKRSIGLVFQDYALFPHLSVKDNILYGFKGKRNEKINAELIKMLEMMKLVGLENKKISELSGGEKQRVALARVIIMKPELLLLDESLNALDRDLRLKMQQELKNIQKKTKITTILVTHDQEEALKLSDEIIVMKDGKVIDSGKPAQLYDKPKNKFMAEFLGGINIFSGRVIGKEDNFYEIENNGKAMWIKSENVLENGKKYTFGIRPEKIKIEPQNAKSINGVVEDIIFEGNIMKYDIKIHNTTVFRYEMHNSDYSENIKKFQNLKIVLENVIIF